MVLKNRGHLKMFIKFQGLAVMCVLQSQFFPMSRIEHKYCTCTSYLAGLFDIFILLHI